MFQLMLEPCCVIALRGPRILGRSRLGDVETFEGSWRNEARGRMRSRIRD
jgi:hypothetical protein